MTVRKAVCAPDAGAFCGVDLDACVDLKAGGVASWAEGIVQELDSYAEFSPSGTGLHVLLGAELPSGAIAGAASRSTTVAACTAPRAQLR
jgi:hypothetical protein